jgi:NAD(P)-dependent dehydrogenase (short-subunit alcohol dehydrogenase family)
MSNAERSGFGPDSTTDQVLDGIDLAGRLAVVTGGSGGLGAETARALASKGASVIIAARDLGKANAVADQIRASTGNDGVSVGPLDLGSLASVRSFAEWFLAGHDSLQLLINNAGVMACPYGTTTDGFELQFGTNHVGHFLLTGLLAPALVGGAPARVVNLSSRGHQLSPVVFDDIGFQARPYEKWSAYGQSKTANVLFTVELDRRLADRGVRAFAVHPGVIPTDLSRHMDAADFEFVRNRSASGGGRAAMKTVASGAATSVYAATAPELEDRGGLYLEDCHVVDVNDDPSVLSGVRSYAVDIDAARRLWTVSEEMVGRRFDL